MVFVCIQEKYEEQQEGIKFAIIFVTSKTDFKLFYKVGIDTNYPRYRSQISKNACGWTIKYILPLGTYTQILNIFPILRE